MYVRHYMYTCMYADQLTNTALADTYTVFRKKTPTSFSSGYFSLAAFLDALDFIIKLTMC